MIVFQEPLHVQIEKNKMYFFQNRKQTATALSVTHWHNICEILYVRRGHAEQRINTITTDILPGDVVIIAPCDIHSTQAISFDGCDIDYLMFSVDLINIIETEKFNFRSSIIHDEHNSFKKIFDTLQQNNSQEQCGNFLINVGLIHIIYGLLMKTESQEIRLRYSDIIENICNYIEQAADIRLKTVASYFNYSPEYISRKFHKETGVTYRDRCNKILMQRAVSMLISENSTIEQIAELLGYSDKNCFIRTFRKWYGITPSAYRKRRYTDDEII